MTVDGILLEIESLKNRAEAEAEEKKAVFLKEQPALTELMEKRRTLLLEMLKERTFGRDTSGTDKEIAEISAQIENEFGDWESRFAPQYSCPICSDTGHDTRDGKKVMCTCLLERVYKQIYGGADIKSLKGSFEEFDANVFSDEEQIKRMTAVKRIAESACDYATHDYFTVLGKSGLGKSYLLACMAKKLKSLGKNVLYIDAYRLFDAFHKHRLGTLETVAPIYEADALFIDDLGTEPMTKNITCECLFSLLTERAQHHRLTAIASNLTTEQLMERYTEKVGSRLFSPGLGTLIRVSGNDLRLGGR